MVLLFSSIYSCTKKEGLALSFSFVLQFIMAPLPAIALNFRLKVLEILAFIFLI
jgi:hypothetical protein